MAPRLPTCSRPPIVPPSLSRKAVFTVEEIEPIVTQVVDGHLSGKFYSETAVDAWTQCICEDVMSALADLSKPFKYVGECAQRVSGSPRGCRYRQFLARLES
jgi:hypothetical protein